MPLIAAEKKGEKVAFPPNRHVRQNYWRMVGTMAAMIKMIATTMSNSIREKPFASSSLLCLLHKH
jgi:hypothetical protein